MEFNSQSTIATPVVKRKALFTYQSKLAALLLSPSFLLIGLLVVVPMLFALYLSMNKVEMIAGSFLYKFIGPENYLYMLKDPRFLPTVIQSTTFTVMRVGAALLLGLFVALILNEASIAARLLKHVFLIPWSLSFVMNGLMWKWMLNAEYGIINEIMLKLGLISKYVSWLGDSSTAMYAVVLADAWKAIPFVALVILAGLKTIPDEIYEAAKVDGAGVLQRFFYVTLPNLKAVILVTLVTQTMFSLKTFATVWVTTKGGPSDATMLLNIYAYQQSFMFYNFGYASAVAYVVTALILVITIAYLAVLRMDD